MSRKTYLSAAEQWDKTVALLRAEMTFFDDILLGDAWFLGQITRPHRLFVAGDVVIVWRGNGGGCRQPIYAVSSKGFQVRRKYLKYATFRRSKKTVWSNFQKRPVGAKTGEFQKFETGSLRIVEYPADLANQKPDEPDVRRYVVEILRAG